VRTATGDTQREPAADKTRRLGHIRALDGLRGIAILLVLVEHTETILVPGTVTVDAGPLRGAFLGVDLFFVLSGFLITSLLLGEQADRNRVRFGSFYGRRALRLLPALYLMLFVHVCYTVITGLSLHTEWLTVRGALLYVSNWTWKWDGFESAPGLGQLWSLAIEEQFYLVWPAIAILFLGMRRRTGIVFAVMVAGILAVAIHRAVMWNDGTSWFFLFLRTDTRADSLLVGALLAQLWVRGWSPRRGVVPVAWLATAILALAMVFARSTESFLYLGGFTLVAVCTAALILAAIDGRWSGTRLLELRPLCTIGVVSYGIYLWHMPVFYVVNRYGSGWGAPARVIVAYSVTAVVTWASWKFLEQPILRWGRNRRTKSQVDSGAPEVKSAAPVAEGSSSPGSLDGAKRSR
jgi:peptidoglycan/LPS O-acetylase OafA/YrhL